MPVAEGQTDVRVKTAPKDKRKKFPMRKLLRQVVWGLLLLVVNPNTHATADYYAAKIICYSSLYYEKWNELSTEEGIKANEVETVTPTPEIDIPLELNYDGENTKSMEHVLMQNCGNATLYHIDCEDYQEDEDPTKNNNSTLRDEVCFSVFRGFQDLAFYKDPNVDEKYIEQIVSFEELTSDQKAILDQNLAVASF